MLDQPKSCQGCALSGLSTGFMRPQLATNGYGVTLVGEALGEHEAELGLPFQGRAGFMLTRLIEWAGLDRSRFDIINSVFCRPPNNLLEGQAYEKPAIAHCRTQHWGALLHRSRVLVPLGNVPTGALLGRKGILGLRGYVFGQNGHHIVPTLHPSFIQRGQYKYSAAVIADLQKAVQLAQHGLPPERYDYLLDPSPRAALEWAQRAVASHPRVAFDIETPYKGHDEAESDANDDRDQTYTILRIGFSTAAYSGMSVPWSGEYLPAIRALLDNQLEKIAHNVAYDAPRVRHNGVPIVGIIHDSMIAWHILHSDLPKGLGFVATFTCPWQPEWKSQSSARPAYYNCTDADVTWRSYEWIEKELHTAGIWEVYERDVLRIDPILAHMSRMGMPIDAERRLDRATRLAHEQVRLIAAIDACIPIEARRFSPKGGFVHTPKEVTGLAQIHVDTTVNVCSVCGKDHPTKPHFRTLKRPTAKKPQNPCAGGSVLAVARTVTRYARLDPLKISREQLIRYHHAKGRAVPTKRDKKTRELRPTFDEMSIKRLMVRYKDDPIYELILTYREADKLAGTYLGRIEGIND